MWRWLLPRVLRDWFCHALVLLMRFCLVLAMRSWFSHAFVLQSWFSHAFVLRGWLCHEAFERSWFRRTPWATAAPLAQAVRNTRLGGRFANPRELQTAEGTVDPPNHRVVLNGRLRRHRNPIEPISLHSAAAG